MDDAEKTKRIADPGSRRVGARSGLGLAAAIGLFALAGCVPAEPPARVAAPLVQPPARQEPAPPRPLEVLSQDAREIRFRVESPEGGLATEPAEAELRALLASAGYRLVGANVASEATLRFALEEVAEDDVSGRATERVSLQVVQEGAVVQWLVGPLHEAERRSLALAELVDRLTSSPTLASLAVTSSQRERDRRRDAATARAPQAEASSAEVGFSAALARRCLNQRSRAACTRLADYVASNPAGTDAERARAILERSQGGRPE